MTEYVRSELVRLWLRRLLVLTVKELQQFSRDVILVVFMFYAFGAAVYISGTGITADLRNAKLLTHDADRSSASRDLLYRFRAPYFIRSGEVAEPQEGISRLDRGEAMMVLDIPEQFADALNQAVDIASPQLMVDTSNVTMGYLASAYSDRIAGTFAEEWSRRALTMRGLDMRTLPAIENQSRIWYNPNMNGHWFNAIAEWLTMVTVVAVLLPASALVREKERGTIEQLLVSPVTPLQIMLSKTISMTLVILLGTAVSVYAIMQPLIGVPFRGSAPLFFALTAVYVFSTAGLGLATATFARNAPQVGLLTILMVAPMSVLSGTWTAPEAMPVWGQYAVNISPLHHFIECSYGILLRGAGLDVLWDSALAMAVLGAALFALGLARFRRQFG